VPPETTSYFGGQPPSYSPGSSSSGGTTPPSFFSGGTTDGSNGGTSAGNEAPPPAGAAGVETADPQGFSSGNSDRVSGLRRLLGLGLLGGAFAAAGALALRTRARRIRPGVALPSADDPLLFWDQRLARATAATVRRFAGRI
jgi:hypothetical protein